MKAILYTEYGSPDVLRLAEIEQPQPKAHEVLVKVHAAAANPLDWHLMRGEPFLARLENGFRKPNNVRLGADFAGTVEAVGSQVTTFDVGDAVFGEVFKTGLGSFSEYVCVPENAIAHKPDNITFEEASAVPIAALTALQGLRTAGHIRSGDKVLINGASGGVGSFAVQIAKALKTDVTGVCSTRNVDLVRSIGADHVIDYTRDDFTDNGQHYDLIIDAVGNRSIADLSRALKLNGRCVIAGFTDLSRLFGHILQGRIHSTFTRQQIGLMNTVSTNKDDLLFLQMMLEDGKVKPVIDRCYPLEQSAEAIRYLETGRARGKVIIRVVN